ncbi:AraC family transcriptional regulator [Mycobacterium sp. CBMA271]|uniref:AraC family transcriptional regulator n=1 Tax=unclassified Mycobacteroides TaxID=2618759 RepID=UPI0013240418|nr:MULTISPECIES: helix-turn-helix transcriptional regulator [unclassified Mycobacteroides]MUM16615.1 AraC family transcriptional regulator [Mycobacteroides sp. CBMA 326]MUM22077.1 AraC family transcriptional regulator [Mycobacteroides sp. CBMA 271]
MLINRHVTGVMSLAGGHRIDHHWHEVHQIVYPASGVIAVTTAEGTWIAPPNRALWIPAGAGHEHRFYGPTAFHSVGFDPEKYVVEMSSPTVIAVSPLLRELIISCSDPGELPSDEIARLRGVLVDQLRHSPEQALKLPTPRDERLAEACALVEGDLTTVWTVAELGRQVGASERTLTRLFRTDMGMTYPQWRTQIRLHHALRLLAEDKPVTYVAHQCGWATPSAFIDVYRRTLGQTPGTYASPVMR